LSHSKEAYRAPEAPRDEVFHIIDQLNQA